jgi:hypothetical protein
MKMQKLVIIWVVWYATTLNGMRSPTHGNDAHTPAHNVIAAYCAPLLISPNHVPVSKSVIASPLYLPKTHESSSPAKTWESSRLDTIAQQLTLLQKSNQELRHQLNELTATITLLRIKNDDQYQEIFQKLTTLEQALLPVYHTVPAAYTPCASPEEHKDGMPHSMWMSCPYMMPLPYAMPSSYQHTYDTTPITFGDQAEGQPATEDFKKNERLSPKQPFAQSNRDLVVQHQREH